MKLELKHLAPYLPYNLYFIRYEKKCMDKTVTPVIWSDELFPFKTQLNPVTLNGFNYELSKPILRPISDLTKEIEVNGEKFVPRNKMGLIHDVSGNNILNYRTGERIDILSLPYYQIQYLFKWLFDVFGLIPQGLAIDINTL